MATNGLEVGGNVVLILYHTKPFSLEESKLFEDRVHGRDNLLDAMSASPKRLLELM